MRSTFPLFKILTKSKYIINKQISCQAKLKKLIHLIPFSTIKYYLKIEYTHVSKYMLTLEKKKQLIKIHKQ